MGKKRNFFVVVVLGVETLIKNGTKNVMKGTENVHETRLKSLKSYFVSRVNFCFKLRNL